MRRSTVLSLPLQYSVPCLYPPLLSKIRLGRKLKSVFIKIQITAQKVYIIWATYPQGPML